MDSSCNRLLPLALAVPLLAGIAPAQDGSSGAILFGKPKRSGDFSSRIRLVDPQKRTLKEFDIKIHVDKNVDPTAAGKAANFDQAFGAAFQSWLDTLPPNQRERIANAVQHGAIGTGWLISSTDTSAVSITRVYSGGDSTAQDTLYKNNNENTSAQSMPPGHAITPVGEGEPVGVLFWLQGTPTAVSADPARPPQVTYGIEDDIFRTTVVPGDDKADILGRIATTIRQAGYAVQFRPGPEPRILVPFPRGLEFTGYRTECLDTGLAIHWSMGAKL